MKERTGFVSNSSSSSFCVYGAYIKASEAKKIVEALKIEDGEDAIWTLGNYMEQNSKMSAHYGDCDYDSKVVVGVDWNSMQDDETFGDFKKKIQTEIKTLLKVEDDKVLGFGIHEEGWYNG